MRKLNILVAAMAVMICLTGCGTDNRQIATVTKQAYVPVQHILADVQLGDLQPVVNLELKQEGLTVVNYPVTGENLEIKSVNVKIGDKVKKGDVLMDFKSEEIDSQLLEYNNRIEEDNLLIDHYTQLGKIDIAKNYKSQISILQRDIEVCNLYVEELNTKLDFYKVVAGEDGTVSYIDKYIAGGYYTPTPVALKITSGTGNYTAMVLDEYEYNIGEVYTAFCEEIPYEFKLVSRVPQEYGSEKAQVLTFEPVSDVTALLDNQSLTMSITKDVIKDAVYVDSEAITKAMSQIFVYVQKENGSFERRQVSLGGVVDKYTIIEEGLSGGEKVILK